MAYIAPSTAEQKIQAGYLSRCSPQAAYDWLQAQVPRSPEELRRVRNIFSFKPADLAEYVLLRRCDPLIDLGLARYAFTPRAVRRAYHRGGAAVRIAAWTNLVANGSRFGTDIWASKTELENLVAVGHEDELAMFAANPILDESTLSAMIGKKDAFSGLTEMRWVVCLVGLSKNPRLNEEYGDDRPMDGMAEFTHNKLFSEVWGLAATMPTEQWAAQLLGMLLQNCRFPFGLDKQADELIARWRIDRERKPDDKYYNPGSSFHLRSRLVDLLKPDSTLLASDDKAVRLSFWRRFDPRQHPGWMDDMSTAVEDSETESDANDVLSAALSNNQLWKSEDSREALRSLCWSAPDRRHDMLMANTHASFERKIRVEHPEWFLETKTQEPATPQWKSAETEPSWVSALVERIDNRPARIPVVATQNPVPNPDVTSPWWSSFPWWAWAAVGFFAARLLPTLH